MAQGTAPTRQEIIMSTPVEDVLAKETWDDVDIEILIANQHVLDEATKERIGITKIVPLSAEEVAAQTESLGGEPEEEVVEEVATEEEAETEEVVDNGDAN